MREHNALIVPSSHPPILSGPLTGQICLEATCQGMPEDVVALESEQSKGRSGNGPRANRQVSVTIHIVWYSKYLPPLSQYHTSS